MDALYDELGDVLLQVVMHAQIAREHGEFDLSDVTTAICKKLIFRHPHVFGTAAASTSDEVLVLWEAQKKKEKRQNTQAEAMRGITRALPATKRAAKVQKKAADVHFDWNSAAEALCKVREEAAEVQKRAGPGPGRGRGNRRSAVLGGERGAAGQGGPGIGAQRATQKFIGRFAGMEAAVLRDGRRLEKCPLPKWIAIGNRKRKRSADVSAGNR